MYIAHVYVCTYMGAYNTTILVKIEIELHFEYNNTHLFSYY